MSRRERKKTDKARRACAKTVPKAAAFKRRPLSAYPMVGDAYDISQMLPETRCRMAGRLLVTERLWASVILSAPNYTEADWRIYDVAQWVKTLCVGDKLVEGAVKEWARLQAARGNRVGGLRCRAINNRTVEFWFFIEEDDTAAGQPMKLVNLADGNGSSDMIVMLADEDEVIPLAARGLSPNNNERQFVYTREEAIRDGALFSVKFSPPPDARFNLGPTFVSRGVHSSGFSESDEFVAALLAHARGDWGCICAADAMMNEAEIRDKRGTALMSVWDGPTGKFWIITEKDATTVLFPNEY